MWRWVESGHSTEPLVLCGTKVNGDTADDAGRGTRRHDPPPRLHRPRPRHILIRHRRCRADPRTHLPRPAPRQRARSRAPPQRRPPGRSAPTCCVPREAARTPASHRALRRRSQLPGHTPAHPEQIAAKVHRQLIGAVFANICRDLGILPGHPLRRELQIAVIKECGNFTRLVKDILDQAFPLSAVASLGSPAPTPRCPAPVGTGPP